MLITAGAVGGGVLLLIGGWSLVGRGSGPVPVVQADSRPIRVRPEVRGGMQVTGANEDILSGAASKQADALGAPTELPQTEQLRQMQQAEAERARAAEAARVRANERASERVAMPEPSSQPVAEAPAPQAALQPSQMPAPLVPVKPALRSAPEPVPATLVPVIASAPIQTPAAIKPAIKPAETPRAAGTRPAEVQLAAVGSEEAAKLEWHRLTTRMPELLGGRKPDVSKVERDGRVFWRVRVPGFADAAEAGSFCERVRGKGAGCSVASF
jgi:hypothetical protein